jgi:hypothetical protein
VSVGSHRLAVDQAKHVGEALGRRDGAQSDHHPSPRGAGQALQERHDVADVEHDVERDHDVCAQVRLGQVALTVRTFSVSRTGRRPHVTYPTSAPGRGNLPQRQTCFLAEVERVALEQLMQRRRLVTLAGPEGSPVRVLARSARASRVRAESGSWCRIAAAGASPRCTTLRQRPGTNGHPTLPVPLTSFVGRQQELARLEELLGGTRLLTLVGAGGVGKTRLALRLAEHAAERFVRGVSFVDLAPLAHPDLLAQAVASAVGTTEQAGRSLVEMLTDALQAKSTLLVLDNCEHLVDACAELAQTLLRTCPDLRILATSREPLAVDGEVTWAVPPLSLAAGKPIATAGRGRTRCGCSSSAPAPFSPTSSLTSAPRRPS